MIRLALLLLLLPASALAQPLTLDQALLRAERFSTELQLQELSAEAAEARWLADPRAGSPSLRLGLRDIDLAPGSTAPPELAAKIRAPLPRPWELATAARQADATVAREDAELAGMRERLQLAVTRRFHALPLLRESVTWAGRLAELRAQHVRLVEQRRAGGLATALDWLASEEARRDAADRHAERLAELEATEGELRSLLRWPADQALEIAPDDRAQLAIRPIPSGAALTGRGDPAVRAAEAEIARANARLERVRLRALPAVDWVQSGAVFRKGRQPAFEIGVSIDIPVQMWSPDRTRAASDAVSRATLELHQAEQDADARLARRVRAADAARTTWRVEMEHRDAIADHAAPLIDHADPLLKLELEARLVQAELRVQRAFQQLVEARDRLDAAAW